MMNLQQIAHWRTSRAVSRMAPTQPQHLGQLLNLLSNTFELRTLAKCHERGHRKFRCSHTAVIAQLDNVGRSLGDLAEHIGISQQATGKLVRDLERAGYIDSYIDSRDKRSRIIQLTPSGLLLKTDIAEVLDEVRDEIGEILGGSGLTTFEQQLRNAASALTESGH